MLHYEILTLTQTLGKQKIDIHPVLLFNETEVILCDAGYPNQIDQINNELKKYGFTIYDITKIVITHQDHDHVGSLQEIKKQNKNVRIISSEEEAPYIEGKKESLRLAQAEEYNKTLSEKDREFGIQFANYLKTIPNCSVDETVRDGDMIIPGLKAVATPGHTPGHISLFLTGKKILFAGDALALENEKLVIANPDFTLDPESCKASIKKIRELSPEKISCYHGGSIEENIDSLLEEILSN